MNNNEYAPFISEIIDVKKHTEIEYTFKMAYKGEIKPGQFFEVSIPKYGEAPISVSGIENECVDLTIRKVGRVTNEIFEQYAGDKLFMRGPYGNGFDINLYKGKDIAIVAGGTGVSPVKGVIDYFSENNKERKNMALIAGFKSPNDILFKENLEKWDRTMDMTLTVDGADEGYDGKVGLVTKYIQDINFRNKKDAVAIVVGPPAMMKFSIIELIKSGFIEENIWMSYERKMCCGIGKCGHCKIDDTYICLEGPVFNYIKGKTLVD